MTPVIILAEYKVETIQYFGGEVKPTINMFDGKNPKDPLLQVSSKVSCFQWVITFVLLNKTSILNYAMYMYILKITVYTLIKSNNNNYLQLQNFPMAYLLYHVSSG